MMCRAGRRYLVASIIRRELIANMEELFREMALSQCLQNDSSTTNMSGSVSVNLTCYETHYEMLGWIYATEFDVLRNWVVAAVVIAVYVLVIVVGTLGSLLVIVSVVGTRQMWTATNVFIANLAFTDLFVCALDLPLSLHYQVGCILSIRSRTCSSSVIFKFLLTLTL